MLSQTPATGMDPGLRIAAPLDDPGREGLLDAAREAAAAVGVVATGSTGHPALEPLVLATVDGRTALLPRPDATTVLEAVDALAEGTLPDSAANVVDHEAGSLRLPVPDHGPLAVGRRRVTRSCGWLNPLAPGDWELLATEAEASATEVGIRARGRGDAVSDEPAATAWTQASEREGEALVVVNAHEADDGSRADRLLLESAPVAVLDGAAAVAAAAGAETVICYLNEADDSLVDHLRTAADAVAVDLPVEVQVVTGPDRYLAGAPTVALEAMEGADRLEPRLQPPGPAAHGLYGRPTVLHTPRTVAQVRAALATPEAFDAGADDPGTRLVSVCGDVEAPAVVELPTDGTLAAVREVVTLDGAYKMACVGGPLGGLTRDLSVPPSAPALRGAGLGTDGVVELLSQGRCPLAVAGERAQFAAEANSGRCVPGREGTVQLTELLRAVYDGSVEETKLRELGRVMQRSANCQIGSQAPRPALTAFEEFSSEVRAHADGGCPSGACGGSL